MVHGEGFGQRLNECIKEAGYTNTELTQRLKLSKNAIGNYKNNQIPNATILYNLSQILGTTMEYLLTGKENNKNQLTELEQEMLQKFKLLPELEQAKIIGRIELLLEQQEQLGKLSTSNIG